MAVFDTLGCARFLADLVTKEDLGNALEMQALRLSVRIGVMLAAGLSLMTAIIGTLIRLH